MRNKQQPSAYGNAHLIPGTNAPVFCKLYSADQMGSTLVSHVIMNEQLVVFAV
jgi:hypothetical protein